MERTIRVTGKGKLSVKPDTIRLLITQTELCPEYDAAVKASSEEKLDLNERLIKLGFDKKDLKTLQFSVDSETESYQGKDKAWKKRLIGYRFTHRMKLEFPADNAVLGKVLYMLAHCPGKPEFSIIHTVKDPEASKSELLAAAVADSRRKAETLALSAGVRLGELQLIDYSWGELEIVSSPMRAMRCDSMEGFDMDIEADDIDITDTVTVVWTIE